MARSCPRHHSSHSAPRSASVLNGSSKKNLVPLIFSIAGVARHGRRLRPPQPSPVRRCSPILHCSVPSAVPPSRAAPSSTLPIAQGEGCAMPGVACACVPIHLAPSAGRGRMCHRSSSPGRLWPLVTLCFKCSRRFRTCCKAMFQVFQLFQMYVSSVSYG